MADPISAATAIVGIPGIFKSCVDCFQYVRLGQRFGEDYGVCLAKLGAAEVRLTRWGEPMGLLKDEIDIQGPFTAGDIVQAYRWLVQIKAAFEEAKEVAAKYVDDKKKKGKDKELVPLSDDQMDSESSVKRLVISLKSVARERQRNLSLPRKITWALYGKDSFDDLIENVVTLTGNLVELFPSNKQRLKELCQHEVNNLNNESILQLGQVLKNEDEEFQNTDDVMLSDTIRDYVESHRLEFRNINIDGHGNTHLGDKYGFRSGVKPGTVSIDGMHIKSSGETHVGHVFQGK